jgi:hypothetical protein
MRKLAGLLTFVIAVAVAIAVTRYYSTPTQPKELQQPVPAATQAAPAATIGDAGANVPVSFKPQLVTLDLANKKAHVTLALERDPARPAPEQVWVWAYFFTPDAPGRYCAGDPVEVRRPFASGNRASVVVDSNVADCPAPRAPSSTFYARVNVSAESAFAARLGEQRISYDITQASPVTVEGAQPKKH